MFTGTIESQSHEGGLLVRFEGSSPSLDAILVLAENGTYVGKVDGVLGSTNQPMAHIGHIDRELKLDDLLGSHVTIRAKKPRQDREKFRRDSRDSRDRSGGSDRRNDSQRDHRGDLATVATGENNALHSTITTGHAQNVKILTLPSARRATDVKHPVLVAVEVPVTTAVVQTDDHNEMVDVTSNVAETTGKKSTTITTGHAENATTRISHSDKPATDVKHLALAAVEVDLAEAEVETDAAAAEAVMVAVDTVAEAEVETDAAAAEAVMVAVDTVAEAEVETDAAAAEAVMVAVDTVAEAEVETDAAAAEAVMVAVDTVAETEVETDAAAAEAVMVAVDTVAETEVETDAAAAEAVMVAVMVAVDTVEETEVETDAAAAGTVVITIAVHRAPTQIFAMQRANAQDTLTTGDQTTFNRGSPTDTTIDWRLTT